MTADSGYNEAVYEYSKSEQFTLTILLCCLVISPRALLLPPLVTMVLSWGRGIIDTMETNRQRLRKEQIKIRSGQYSYLSFYRKSGRMRAVKG